MKLVITGGAAEGKSTVAQMLGDAGLATASADELARRVFDDPVVQSELARALEFDLPLDREDFTRRIFESEAARMRANRIMHPRILASLEAAPEPVLEVPLLIEACLWSRFDCVWVVTCGPEEQFRRLMERHGNEDPARQIMAAQLPAAVKCAFADRIVRTNVPLESVRSYVNAALAYDLPDHLA